MNIEDVPENLRVINSSSSRSVHGDSEREVSKKSNRSKKGEGRKKGTRAWENTSLDPTLGREYFFENLGRLTVWGSLRDDKLKDELKRENMDLVESMTTFTDDEQFTVVVKSGWALKRSAVVKSWSRRWFVLKRRKGYSTMSYYKSDQDEKPQKTIRIGPTTRVVTPLPDRSDREHQIIIIGIVDGVEKQFHMAADSSLEQRNWAAMVQVTVEGAILDSMSDNYGGLYRDTGIGSFVLRYGVRKLKSRGNVQTRVLEVNFIDKVVYITKRGQIIESSPFSGVSNAVGNESHREGHTLEIRFKGNSTRSWVLFLDSAASRNDLLQLMEEIIEDRYTPKSLRMRHSELLLKKGCLERKNIPGEEQMVTPNATLKGRFMALLSERSVGFIPADGVDGHITERPWFVVGLGGLEISHDAPSGVLTFGKVSFVASSSEECSEWFQALQEAATLPMEVIEKELSHRMKLRVLYQRVVRRIRRLLYARVTPKAGLPLNDDEKVVVMLQRLWDGIFPDEQWEGMASTRWQEIGFQRGGPASDLRASGLLGLHCLIYFVEHYREEICSLIKGQLVTMDDSKITGYPVCVAGINVVALMVEMFGLGDAGIHTEGWSRAATQCFAALVCDEAEKRMARQAEKPEEGKNGQATTGKSSESVNDTGIFVFEELFCIFLPLLDRLFVEMGAGYMEFGQVLRALRRQIDYILSRKPKDIETARRMAGEPATDILESPLVVSQNAPVHVRG